tara:strand:+ start:3331 stop:4485 length:1155 start_codon:yes stop_codon:yes gene_type:complete
MMADVVRELHEGWTANFKVDGKDEYTRTFLVTVDSPSKGPIVIAALADIPNVGSEYSGGGDGTPESSQTSICKSLTFNPVDTLNWKVVATFGSRDNDDEQEQDNDPEDQEDNPFNDPPELSIGMIRTKTVAAFGAFLGWYEVNTAGEAGGFVDFQMTGAPSRQTTATLGAGNVRGGIANGTSLVNSALVPYDPPLERDRARIGFRVQTRLASFPIEDYMLIDSVNNDTWILNHPHRNFNFTFPKYTCKMQSITGAFKFQQVGNAIYRYWSLEYEFHYDPFTWRVDLLDYGYSQNELGAGATYDGLAEMKRLAQHGGISSGGSTPKEPLKLDGNGQYLNNPNVDSVFLRYAIYPEVPWSGAVSHRLNNTPSEQPEGNEEGQPDPS